jgi:hypothetical protein
MKLVVEMWRGTEKLTTADKYMMADFLTKAGMGRSSCTAGPAHIVYSSYSVNCSKVSSNVK